MDDERLINLVQQHECLYNVKNREYKNVARRTKLFEEIGKELKMTGDECAHRWRNLRDRFSKELKIMHSKGLETDSNPRWYLFPAMSFMSNFVAFRNKRKREEFYKMDPISLSSQESSATQIEAKWNTYFNQISDKPMEDILPPKDSEFSPSSSIQILPTSPTPSGTTRKRTFSESAEDTQMFATYSKTAKKNNNLQNFANIVTDLMEPLSKRKQLQLMQQIFTLVTSAQIEEISAENNIS